MTIKERGKETTLKEMLAVLLNVPVETFESRDFKENVYIDFNDLSFHRKETLNKNQILSDSKFSKKINDMSIDVRTNMLSVRQLLQYWGTEIMRKSLDNYGYILVAESMEQAIDTVNEIASEHLEILTKNPFDIMTRIKNAGAIFLGEYSSEPLGDYFAGPNHILPTNGTAKFFSPVNVDDFIKKSSIISYSRQALEAVHKDIELFAESEGLTAHANSIKVRFED